MILCLTICQRNEYSFMDNGNVAEITSLQSAIYLKYDITRASNGLYFPGLHAFSKVWLKLKENFGSSSLLKMLTSGILQSALNDLN